MKKIYDGKLPEVYNRATDIFRDAPDEVQEQLRKLYIACNIISVLVNKPADMIIGDGIELESGEDDESTEQKAINRIKDRNTLEALVHETLISGGTKGDMWLKTFYSKRFDTSGLEEEGLSIPENVTKKEPIIEAIPADQVFPEVSDYSEKKFKCINVCSIDWVEEQRVNFWGITDKEEVPYLNVERHFPGYIKYERYRLSEGPVNNEYGYPVMTFTIVEEVDNKRGIDWERTGLNDFAIKHIPYKSVDDDWNGEGNIEKLESVLAAINDRLVQIDYILWKHADPTAYGPELETKGNTMNFGGKYIPVGKEDHEPGYMTWDARLELAFKELDYLLSIVFQMSETPQWLFGTTITQDKGGTGTSHTDSRAIKLRMMPILSKVSRIKLHLDKALKDVIYNAQVLENYANRDVVDFTNYTPVRPKIHWHDPLPKDEKEEAEIMEMRTGDKPTLDVHTAIKRLDNVDDDKVRTILDRIKEDEKREEGFVDGSVFNEPLDNADEEVDNGGEE